MSICPHCKGTGKAPLTLKQECIGCQRTLTVKFASIEEMVAGDGRVYCSECKSSDPESIFKMGEGAK